jgi:AcrR family transcriptional regulator
MSSDARPSAARRRILETADRLFYAHGIRAIGVDRIVAEAQVTRVTFYRHFPGKEDLVEAYLRARADAQRTGIDAMRAANADDPRAVLDAIAHGVADECTVEGFRGCEFINAAAEYADDSAAARRLAVEQREWVTGVFSELLDELGRPKELAEVLLMLYTGVVFAGGLDHSTTSSELFLRTWRSVVDGA